MLAIHLYVGTVSTFNTTFTNNPNPLVRSISNSLSCCCSSSSSSSSSSPLQLALRTKRSHGFKSLFFSCKASQQNFGKRSNNGDDHDDNYIQAIFLAAETMRHHNLRTLGFVEETNWSSGNLVPFYIQAKESSRTALNSIGHGFLRRFQSPTIFLKVSCDGDFLLPITVGEVAIESLVDALRDDERWDLPNQFQFVKILVEKLGYEVKMVRITERVVNTYYARIYFSKPGEKAILSVDARPSDAINVAKRCKVAIYVNKQIVITDAIKMVYGSRRRNDSKSVYDVTLDSAVEGPDLLAEELDLVRNMNIAVEEERYKDAAVLRDKLEKLRTSKQDL